MNKSELTIKSENVLFNQSAAGSLKDIYIAFLELIYTDLELKAYKLRRSKREIYKKKGNFTILFDIQVLSGNMLRWKDMPPSINLDVHNRIEYKNEKTEIVVYPETKVGYLELGDITPENFQKILRSILEYALLMEQIVTAFLKGEAVSSSLRYLLLSKSEEKRANNRSQEEIKNLLRSFLSEHQ